MFIILFFMIGLIGDIFVLLAYLLSFGACCQKKYNRGYLCVTKYRFVLLYVICYYYEVIIMKLILSLYNLIINHNNS